jgi:hypothetical protein
VTDKVVPIEVTPEMIKAGVSAFAASGGFEYLTGADALLVADIYRAMVACTSQPASGQDETDHRHG